MISAVLPAAIPPVTLALLQSYLKLVDNLDGEIKLLEGRIRESLIGKSRELQILTPVSDLSVPRHLLLRSGMFTTSKMPTNLQNGPG